MEVLAWSTKFLFTISHLWHGNPSYSLLSLGVCQGSGTSGGSGQNAAERHPGTGSPAQSWLLQSALSVTEDDRGVVTCDRLVESEWVHHPHQVLHGDSLIGLGVDQEGGHHVLDRPQGHILSDSSPCGVSYVSAVCYSGNCVPVPGILLQQFYCSPGLYQGIHSGFGVGSSEGDLAPLLSG